MADELADRLDGAIDAVVARGDATARCGIRTGSRSCGLPPTYGTTRAPTSRHACVRNWNGGQTMSTADTHQYSRRVHDRHAVCVGAGSWSCRLPHSRRSTPWKRASLRAADTGRIANCASAIPCSCSAKARRVKSCRAGRWRSMYSWTTSTRLMRKRSRPAASRWANRPIVRMESAPASSRMRSATTGTSQARSARSPSARALRTVTPYLHSRDVRGYIDFLVRAFGASEEVLHELPGGVIPYARARVGDAAIELGTADPMPGAFCLYVADPDLVYEQAVAAGAKALSPPVDQPSGDRMAFVEDALGNQWYITRPALR